MMNDFVFEFRNDSNGLPCECCSAPADFLAGYPELEMHPFCRICVGPFVLQTLKLKGVDLSAIEAGFLKLSAALDAPQGSMLLQ
jgi:hypothetical protein